MTESEWLASAEPRAMVKFIIGHNANLAEGIGGGVRVSDRKLRLFACACACMAGIPAERVALMESRGAPTLGGEPRGSDAEFAMAWTDRGSGKPPATQKADLLREVVGNPFRPVCIIRPMARGGPEYTYIPGEAITPQATAVARDVYEGGVFGELPVLADALEDGGCRHEGILGHLRSPGPHVRGCWALDLILGNS